MSSNRRPPAGSQPLGSPRGNSRGKASAGSTGPAGRPVERYGDSSLRRMALAPGLLGAIVLIAGLALLDLSTFVIILYATSILALIVGWFAIQAKQWWWLPLLAAIAVIWNPVFPFGFHGQLWVGGQFIAAIVFAFAAVFIKVRVADDRAGSQRPGRPKR